MADGPPPQSLRPSSVPWACICSSSESLSCCFFIFKVLLSNLLHDLLKAHTFCQTLGRLTTPQLIDGLLWIQDVPHSRLIVVCTPLPPSLLPFDPVPLVCCSDLLNLDSSADPCPKHQPSPELFLPPDHVAMHPLAAPDPHLAVLCHLVPGGELSVHLPVPGPSHCGLQRSRAHPSSQ